MVFSRIGASISPTTPPTMLSKNTIRISCAGYFTAIVRSKLQRALQLRQPRQAPVLTNLRNLKSLSSSEYSARLPRALSTRSAVIRFQEIPRALAAVQIPAARARPRQCSAAAQGIGGTHHSRTPRPPHPNPRLHRPRTIVRARQQCAREPSPPSAAGCAGPLERRQQDSSAVPAQPQNHFPLLLAGCPPKYPSQMQRLPSPEKFRPRPSPPRAAASSLSSPSREPLLPLPHHSRSTQIP